MIPTIEIPRFENTCGVYHLVKAGKVVYVGASTNVLHRAGSWMGPEQKRKPLDFDSVRIFLVPPHKLEQVEREQLAQYKPDHNAEGVIKPYRCNSAWGWPVAALHAMPDGPGEGYGGAQKVRA